MVSDSEKEERLIRELLGDSRDKHLGRLLDARAHQLIKAFNSYDNEIIRELCAEDVTLITGNRGGEEIYKGVGEIVEFLKSDGIPDIQVIISIVDRRHIICPVEVFHYGSDWSYTQQRRVMIFDIDEAGKIKRIEIRPIRETEHKTSYEWSDVEKHKEMGADNGL